MGALTGLRVLDLSRILAGPWCTQILGDLGAEIVKIERPGAGDDTRGWGPPFLRDRDGAETGESAYFLAMNRNKKSVTIDMATAEGQSLLRQMAARCDILVENFKVGTLEKYGLDYATLSKSNPGLIYCSITGFGQSGPYANRSGYDFIAQGMGGLMSITGERDDLPGGGPQKVGVAIADITTGMYAAVSILAALNHRHASGRGQHLDCNLLDTQVAMLANLSLNYLVSGKVPQRAGNAHQNIMPYNVFRVADGHIILAIGNDAQFASFCKLAGYAALAENPRYATNADRIRNREALTTELTGILAGRSKRAWSELLDPAGIPCGPIHDLEEVFADPHVVARQMQRHMDHPLADSIPTVAHPVRYSETDADYRLPPPLLGQHTATVLRNVLGLSDEDLDRLARQGVIGIAEQPDADEERMRV